MVYNNNIIYYVGAHVSGIRRDLSRVHDAALVQGRCARSFNIPFEILLRRKTIPITHLARA